MALAENGAREQWLPSQRCWLSPVGDGAFEQACCCHDHIYKGKPYPLCTNIYLYDYTLMTLIHKEIKLLPKNTYFCDLCFYEVRNSFN